VQSREVQKASPFIVFCPLQQPAIPKPVKNNIKINISNDLFDIMPIFNWISKFMGIAADAERRLSKGRISLPTWRPGFDASRVGKLRECRRWWSLLVFSVPTIGGQSRPMCLTIAPAKSAGSRRSSAVIGRDHMMNISIRRPIIFACCRRRSL